MKQPSIYLKMRVLGAIDTAPGKTRHERVHQVAATTFLDEDGNTAVRDAAAKGKIERFFRRVRDQFLVQKLDLSSLESLNKQFTAWVEQDYNAAHHDGLGLKPIDRFGIDLGRIRFFAPSEHADELFFAEATRTVKKDGTFSFQSRRYETPADLRGQVVHIRHDRHRSDTWVSPTAIVYVEGQRMGRARLLDAVANGLRRRKEQA